MKKILDNYDPYVVLEKRKNNRKKYYQTAKGKQASKKGQLKLRYNLSLEEYNQKLKEQKHSCAICRKDEVELPKKLAVDHNHVTGQIRGLLCTSCNLGLGYFKDDINLFLSAIEYLNKHK